MYVVAKLIADDDDGHTFSDHGGIMIFNLITTLPLSAV